MWDLILKLITDITYCTSVTVDDTTTEKVALLNNLDYDCKIVEVRNTSATMSVKVYTNKVGFFTLLPYERRLVMVKRLSDLRFTLASGSTSTVIELVIEK
jgi:hypothetical protein